jgi:hypothetical protein
MHFDIEDEEREANVAAIAFRIDRRRLATLGLASVFGILPRLVFGSQLVLAARDQIYEEYIVNLPVAGDLLYRRNVQVLPSPLRTPKERHIPL